MKKLQIAIIGSAGSNEYPLGGFDFDALYQNAYQCGKLCAQRGAIIITGGKSGIMEGASKGAKDGGGTTVGFVKGDQRNVSNPYIDVEIVTNMGLGGDGFLIPYSADGAIIIGGGVGTLKELAGFYLANKPLVALSGTGGYADKVGGSYLDERNIRKIQQTSRPEQAVCVLFDLLLPTP